MRKNNKMFRLKEKCEALHEELKLKNNHWSYHVPVTMFSEEEFIIFLGSKGKREAELILESEFYILQKSWEELSNDYEEDEEFEDVSDYDLLKAIGGVEY
jgi:hypothetical protein